MRTTLDLPEALVEEAMKVTNMKTKTALMIRALQEIIRKSKIEKIKGYKGKIDLDIDLSALRDRK